jgi:hypothetical protein
MPTALPTAAGYGDLIHRVGLLAAASVGIVLRAIKQRNTLAPHRSQEGLSDLDLS